MRIVQIYILLFLAQLYVEAKVVTRYIGWHPSVANGGRVGMKHRCAFVLHADHLETSIIAILSPWLSTILSPKCSPFCPYHSVTLTGHHSDIWLSTILLPDHIHQSDKLTVHNSVTLHFIMSIILSPYCPWFCHLTVLHSVTLIVHHSLTPTNM